MKFLVYAQAKGTGVAISYALATPSLPKGVRKEVHVSVNLHTHNTYITIANTNYHILPTLIAFLNSSNICLVNSFICQYVSQLMACSHWT